MEFIDNIYFIYREKCFDKYYILWAFFRARKHMDLIMDPIRTLKTYIHWKCAFSMF